MQIDGTIDPLLTVHLVRYRRQVLTVHLVRYCRQALKQTDISSWYLELIHVNLNIST